MKQLILSIVLVFTLAVGQVNAQQNVPNGTNQSQTTETTGQNEENGVEWWWFLPLLLIPLYFLLRRDDKEDDRSEYRNRQAITGSKGGESQRSDSDENL